MAVETLRPNAAGDAAAHTVSGGSGTNYGVTSDNSDTSYIANTTTNTTKEDDMNLDAPVAVQSEDTIDSIDVRWRARTETSATGSGRPGLRLGGTNSMGTTQSSIPTSATNYTSANVARPGGGSWTFTDLADLQVVIESTRAGNNVRIFELFVDINYTVGGGGSPEPEGDFFAFF